MTKQNYFPLNREVYEQKVLGGWLGKAIGGTLGAPDEGKKEILDLSFYDPVPEGSVPNDDLDLQLVWLHVMQSKRLDIDVNDLAQAWLDHIKYPFDQYGVAISNLKKGLDHLPLAITIIFSTMGWALPFAQKFGLLLIQGSL